MARREVAATRIQAALRVAVSRRLDISSRDNTQRLALEHSRNESTDRVDVSEGDTHGDTRAREVGSEGPTSLSLSGRV